MKIVFEVNTQQIQENSQLIQENSQAIRELRATQEEDRQQIQALRAVQEEDRRQTQDLRASVASLVATSEQFQHNFEASQRNFEFILARIDRIQEEIRGLRVETRRILAHLFGPQLENGDR